MYTLYGRSYRLCVDTKVSWTLRRSKAPLTQKSASAAPHLPRWLWAHNFRSTRVLTLQPCHTLWPWRCPVCDSLPSITPKQLIPQLNLYESRWFSYARTRSQFAASVFSFSAWHLVILLPLWPTHRNIIYSHFNIWWSNSFAGRHSVWWQKNNEGIRISTK